MEDKLIEKDKDNFIESKCLSKPLYKNDNIEVNIPNKSTNKKKSISFFKLQYSISSKKHNIIAIIAGISSLFAGFAMPTFSFIFGRTMNKLKSPDSANIETTMNKLSLSYLLLGVFMLFIAWMVLSLWTLVGKNLIFFIKKEYFKYIFKQEQAYFDSKNTFEFSTKVQSQEKLIESGIGIKVGNTIWSLTMGLISITFAFAVSWKLTLIMLTILPLLILSGLWLAKSSQDIEEKKRIKYEKAGGVAEEVLYNLKTVASFGNFKYEENKFNTCIDESKEAGYKDGFRTSMAFFFLFFIIYGCYALAIWYGSVLIFNEETNSFTNEKLGPGDVISVLLSIIYGAMALGSSGPNFKSIGTACEASSDFFELVDRTSQLSSNNLKGNNGSNSLKPDKNDIKGSISFQNVKFKYIIENDNIQINNNKKLTAVSNQSNDNTTYKNLFSNLCFDIKAGSKVAIVGESGSGKTTIVNIIERLYNINSGIINIDNYNLYDLELFYWRSLIGYVSQEPMLFNSTIKDNVIFGRDNDNYTDEDIYEALKKASAYEFVKKLPEKLNYKVGIKGSRLSGGQKQRIAIARAVLGKPKFLIFDEATSALDNNTEKIIQEALDNASTGITTLVIAHRLSTVVNCDNILVLDKGVIVEQGSHIELIEKKGYYNKLVNNQMANKINKKDYNNNNIIADIPSIDVDKYSSYSSDKSKSLILNNDCSSNKYSETNDTTNNNSNTKDLKENVKEQNKYYKQARKKFLSLLSNMKLSVISGFICAFLCGASSPGYGYLISKSLADLSIPNKDIMRDRALSDSYIFLIFALYSALSMFGLFYSFTIIGEGLVAMLRKQLFNHYLKLHISYFDYYENSPGALLTKLSTDTTKINGIAFSVIGTIIQSIASVVIGIAIGIYYEYRLALVCLAFMPIIGLSASFRMRREKNLDTEHEEIDVQAGSLLSECVNNTKTVFAYNFQTKALDIYTNILDKKNAGLYKHCIYQGLWFGFNQLTMYSAFATLYYYGTKLLLRGETDFESMNKAIFAVIMAAFGLGNAQIYIVDLDKARNALTNIYKILDIKSEIDPSIELNSKNLLLSTSKYCNNNINSHSQTNINVEDSSEIQRCYKNNTINYYDYNKEKNTNNFFNGKIEFKNVCFSYPTRPDTKVLKNISFIINPGQSVAFVGPSGSGKSSIIQLIERFYDINSGEILIDDINIKEYNLINLRKKIGLVLQEPVLFKTSILENIRYGNLSSSNDQVKEAAKKAYIDKFFNINDYNPVDTNIEKSLVSGGEKQRIAIARSIIKNPTILLLDEATSALDKNSEEIVQKALNEQLKGKTSIIVAHRLSTIVNCDKIYVIKDGIITEKGTHQELISMKKNYFNMYNLGGNFN